MSRTMIVPPAGRVVRIPAPNVALPGELVVPPNARGIVLFAHAGDGRLVSASHQPVADLLQRGGFATLRFDALSDAERAADAVTGHLRRDIDLLVDRLASATEWTLSQAATRDLGLNYFGTGAGVAAALVAAGTRPDLVRAVVALSGRADLASRYLGDVAAPTQLIVGGYDRRTLALNQSALARLGSTIKDLAIVPCATRLFDEPGALDEAARLTLAWFSWYGTDACFRDGGCPPCGDGVTRFTLQDQGGIS